MTYYKRYTKATDALYGSLDKVLGSGVLEGKEAVVFGTSNISAMIIHYLGINGVKVEAIVDNDSSRHGRVVYGATVYKPEDYLGVYDANKMIFVASTYQNEMIAQLEGMGYMRDKQAVPVIDYPVVMNSFDFVDRTGFVPMTQDEIKTSQLGILRRLDEVCREHNIRYYICGGTLLGAVRHGGYIPWDDDIDVVMPLADIIKLSKVLKEDDNYSLISFNEDVEYFDIRSLMVDDNTICDCNGIMQFSTGVGIDVFPFIGVPGAEVTRAARATGDVEVVSEEEVVADIAITDADVFNTYIETMRNLDMEKWNKLYDPKACKEALNKQVEYMLSFDYDKCDVIGNVLGRYFMKDIFPREYFDETVRLKFEDLELTAPKNWDGYLKKLYGDYMKLPPKEKQVAVHYYRGYRKER